MANTQYNRNIRSLVVGFGNLFNDIALVRYNPDGSEQQRMIVPIVYAAKEDYVMRLQGDPDLDKKVMATLPRMSFEMTGMTYDSARKQNTNIRNFAGTATGAISQYNPVPYNFDFNLYIYVRNTEDGTQIIEHILPFFAPDYTIKLNMIPQMGTVKEIPVLLNSATHETDYEGNGATRNTRMIIWTLNFTVKGYIFGQTSNVGLISKAAITNVYNIIDPSDQIAFTMNMESGIGDYMIGEIVYQGYSLQTATATGKVVDWKNGILTLTEIDGNFVSTMKIRSVRPNIGYSFTSFTHVNNLYFDVKVYVDPPNATIDSNWRANTVITEYDVNSTYTPPTPPLPPNSSYVTCTGVDYGQARGHRVQIEGIMTFTVGSTLSDGVNTRLIEGTQSDGANKTIALITTAPPPRWINGTGPLILTLTPP